MNQYIYRLTPNRPSMLTDGPTEQETEVLQRHVTYLEELAGQSTVLLAGRTQVSEEGAFGLVILAGSGSAPGTATRAGLQNNS